MKKLLIILLVCFFILGIIWAALKFMPKQLVEGEFTNSDPMQSMVELKKIFKDEKERNKYILMAVQDVCGEEDGVQLEETRAQEIETALTDNKDALIRAYIIKKAEIDCPEKIVGL